MILLSDRNVAEVYGFGNGHLLSFYAGVQISYCQAHSEHNASRARLPALLWLH